MYIIDFVNYINRRYLSVPSGIATATAIIVTCESFYFTAAKLKYLKKKSYNYIKINKILYNIYNRLCIMIQSTLYMSNIGTQHHVARRR